MQQLKNYKERSGVSNQQNIKISCEECLTDINKEVGVCAQCLAFVCGSCSQSHGCGAPIQLFAQSLEPTSLKNDKPSFNKTGGYDFYFKAGESSQSSMFPQRTSRITCDRCNFKQAAKQCKVCKIKNYCHNCFRQVHGSSKMLGHQSVDLIATDLAEKRSVLNIIHSQFQNMKGDNNKQVYFNLQKTQSSATLPSVSAEDMEQHKKLIKQRAQTMKDTHQVLNSLKNEIQLELKTIQIMNKEFVCTVNRELEKIVEEAKIKTIELQMKIRQKMNEPAQECNQLLRDIRKSQIVSKQMSILMESKITIGLDDKINQKLRRQIQTFKELYKRQDQIKAKNQKQKISDSFFNDIDQICEKVKKFEIRKIITSEDTNKSNINSSYQTPRKSYGDVKSKYDAKSSKNSNGLNSYKSMDKLDSLSMALLPPERQKDMLSKSGNQLNKEKRQKVNVNQTTYYSVINPSDACLRNTNNEKDLSFSVKIRVNPETSKKDNKNKANPQKSVRKTLKGGNMYQSGSKKEKSGVNKTISNIEQTKKLIKNMRTEITDFSKRFALKRDSAVIKRTTTLEDEFSQDLGISHISIESILDKAK